MGKEFDQIIVPAQVIRADCALVELAGNEPALHHVSKLSLEQRTVAPNRSVSKLHNDHLSFRNWELIWTRPRHLIRFASSQRLSRAADYKPKVSACRLLRSGVIAIIVTGPGQERGGLQG